MKDVRGEIEGTEDFPAAEGVEDFVKVGNRLCANGTGVVEAFGVDGNAEIAVDLRYGGKQTCRGGAERLDEARSRVGVDDGVHLGGQGRVDSMSPRGDGFSVEKHLDIERSSLEMVKIRLGGGEYVRVLKHDGRKKAEASKGPSWTL